MTLVSEHIYCKEKTNVLEHVRQLSNEIKRVAEAHRRYRREIPQLAGKDIRLAMDEWNYWYGQYLYGELGVRYFLKDALGVGLGLHEYFRNSDLYFMANYAQTVNVIGAIKTTPTASAFETTGLALKLYRKEFGTIPVDVTGVTGHLDIAAAWTPDKKAVTVAIVNPQAGAEQVMVDLGPAKLGANAKRWLITGAGAQATTNLAKRRPSSFKKSGRQSRGPPGSAAFLGGLIPIWTRAKRSWNLATVRFGYVFSVAGRRCRAAHILTRTSPARFWSGARERQHRLNITHKSWSSSRESQRDSATKTQGCGTSYPG